MKMRRNISNGNLNDMLFEHSLGFYTSDDDKLVKKNKFAINETGLGNIEAEEINIKGISMFEWKAQFDLPTRLYEDMHDNKHFAIYLNLGHSIDNYVGNKKIEISAGSHNIWSVSHVENGFADFLKDQPIHTFTVVLDDKYLLNMVERYPDLLSEVYLQHKKNSVMRWHKHGIPIEKEVMQIVYQIKNANLMGNYAPMYLEGKVLELLSLQLTKSYAALKDYSGYCKNTRDINKMHEAKAILLNDLNNHPTIYELSRCIGMNEKKLRNGFKEVFGQTIYKCLFDHKMEKALNLLMDTNNAISDVAYECGYEYPSHFTTAFKRKYGITPNQYRKNGRYSTKSVSSDELN